MTKSLLRIWLIAVTLVCFPSAEILADGEGLLNKLLAPGPLIEGHKDLEGTDCLKCHASGKGIPDVKCLDCHKEIRKNVELKKGFHGNLEDGCIKCHRDHKGREFETMAVVENDFDHKKTGFSLEGKHEKIKCKECHLEKRGEHSARKGEIRYFGKTNSCASCHKKEDVHFFTGDFAKKDCNACHGVRTWKDDLRFAHRRDTGYDLLGKHQDVKCADCHKVDKKQKTATYEWRNLKSAQCLTCHEDFHKANLSGKYRGGNCVKCHSQDDWKIGSFDHSVTGYPLRGKHQKIDCTKCHVQSPRVAQTQIKASLKNQLKTGLKSQEQVQGTRVVKNYAWHGLGKRTSCVSCHEDYHVFGNLKSKRFGQLAKCESCHNESDWRETKKFDHSTQTRYVVDGKHSEVSCNDCHVIGAKKVRESEYKTTLKPEPKVARKTGKYLWPELALKTCETCHKNPHIGSFSKTMLAKKCTACHVTDGWMLDKDKKNFNHEATRFSLTGKHKRISCNDCHLIENKKVYKFPSFTQKFCIDCHKNEHRQQFSEKFAAQACSTCHSTERFDKLLEFEHDLTRFKLRDAHAKLNCNECHTPTNERFTPLSKTQPANVKHRFVFPNLATNSCVTCHADYHAGQLSADCSKCHSEKTWKKPKFDHNVDSKYLLKGKHFDVKCDQCHRPIRNQYVKFIGKQYPVLRYKPLSAECSECHSDFHSGQLNKDCSRCHGEKGWKETQFNHRTDSSFALKGKHENLKCSECHKPISGQSVRFGDISFPVIRYKPIPGGCLPCHKDPHSGALGQRCGDCHNESNWKKIGDFHRNFTLKGVHYTLSCAECHRDPRHLSGTSEQCILCHKKDDVHNGALASCGECHLQEVWEHSKFKHSMTFFALRGVHRTLQCADCHRSGVYRGLSSQCIDCHRTDAQGVTSPPHIMPNFSNCKSCHNQFAF